MPVVMDGIPPATLRHAELMAQAKKLVTDKERRAFVRKVKEEHSRFAAKWVWDDINAWIAAGRPEGAPCTA